MFVCPECGAVFYASKHYVETHGLSTPPYEHWDGCPICASRFYTQTYECAACGKYIVDDYFKIDEERYCKNCCVAYELGEED